MPLVPEYPYNRTGNYLFGPSKATGGFGWISQGVNAITGDLVAIKELRITSKKNQRHALEEVTVGRAVKVDMFSSFSSTSLTIFQGLPGLVPLLDSWREHNHQLPCGKLPEKYYFSMPLAVATFHGQDWSKLGLEHRLQFYKSSLVGINELHRKGMMHRNILLENILIISDTPPEAAICDYGKGVNPAESTQTGVSPVHTLAPEVWQRKGYTNQIDASAWAYAVTGSLGYRDALADQITLARHASLLPALSKRAKANTRGGTAGGTSGRNA